MTRSRAVKCLLVGALIALLFVLAGCSGDGLSWEVQQTPPPDHPGAPPPGAAPDGIYEYTHPDHPDYGPVPIQWFDTDGDGMPDWIYDPDPDLDPTTDDGRYLPVLFDPGEPGQIGPSHGQIWIDWFLREAIPYIFELFGHPLPPPPPSLPALEGTAEELIAAYGVEGGAVVTTDVELPADDAATLLSMWSADEEALLGSSLVLIAIHGTHETAIVDPTSHGILPGNFGFERIDPDDPGGPAFTRTWLVGTALEIGDYLQAAGFHTFTVESSAGLDVTWHRGPIPVSNFEMGRAWWITWQMH